MTNISEDRRVVLTALREVPYETTFLLSEATQDQSIKNRYWFDLPGQWTHQANKDPIIGIRSIYFTKTTRFIKYSYKISLNDLDEHNKLEPVDTIEGTITHWLDGNDTIRRLTDKFNEQWLSKGTTSTPAFPHHTWKADEIKAYYDYDGETKKTYLYIGCGILEPTYFTYEAENETHILRYTIEITALSPDTETLFGGTNFEFKSLDTSLLPRVAIQMWSRHQCLVKSSIAVNDKNNILGHTLANYDYAPIKYFRLNHDVKRFWIELYETRYHECPVVFPFDKQSGQAIDKRDDLFIEAILAFSSQGML